MGWWISKAKPRNTTIKIGGVEVEVKPLSLENALRLTLLLAPHVGRIERRLPQIKQAVGNGRLLEALLKDLAQEMAFAPGDVVTAYGLLLDVPPEWIAQEATAKELIEALPALDRVNDFKGLFQAIDNLGLVSLPGLPPEKPAPERPKP